MPLGFPARSSVCVRPVGTAASHGRRPERGQWREAARSRAQGGQRRPKGGRDRQRGTRVAFRLIRDNAS